MGRRRGVPKIGVVSDAGHSLLKTGVRGADGDWQFTVAPHALHELQRKQWEQIVERSASQPNAVDYVQVGQQYYIMGDSAERYAHATRKMGAARYTRDYIGVQTMAMVARAAPVDEAEVVILALHPPADAEYRKELRSALTGQWDVLLGNGRECLFKVTQVITLDEPVAGLMNVAIDDRLRENKAITAGEVLVLDIGGGTTSVAPVLPGGSVDYGRADSYPMGILNVTARLQQNLFNQYRTMFMKTRQIRPDRLRDALITEQFRGGGKTINCKDEVRAAKAELLTEIERMYFDGSIGGPLQFDAIILTGGGSAAIGNDLRALLDHKRIYYSTDDAGHIHLANAFGAAKLFDIFEADGDIRL